MSRLCSTLGIALLTLTLFSMGCRPKPTPTTPDEVAVVNTPAPAPERVQPPPAPPTDTDVAESPWWQNKSLVELNDEAARRGFYREVYFEFDKADLTDDSRQRLAANARFLKENAKLQATIEGHCDERGTFDYNIALGDRRANTAKDYVSSLGVDGSRQKTISYGEEKPVCTGTDESCWGKNRRAVFILSLAS